MYICVWLDVCLILAEVVNLYTWIGLIIFLLMFMHAWRFYRGYGDKIDGRNFRYFVLWGLGRKMEATMNYCRKLWHVFLLHELRQEYSNTFWKWQTSRGYHQGRCPARCEVRKVQVLREKHRSCCDIQAPGIVLDVLGPSRGVLVVEKWCM